MIHIAGISRVRSALVLPVSTGMAIMLSLMALKEKYPGSKYVIWPRIDQKSCFKAIISAGLTPIVIENRTEGDELRTDIEVNILWCSTYLTFLRQSKSKLCIGGAKIYYV